jgi:hypothetical protein
LKNIKSLSPHWSWYSCYNAFKPHANQNNWASVCVDLRHAITERSESGPQGTVPDFIAVITKTTAHVIWTDRINDGWLTVFAAINEGAKAWVQVIDGVAFDIDAETAVHHARAAVIKWAMSLEWDGDIALVPNWRLRVDGNTLTVEGPGDLRVTIE